MGPEDDYDDEEEVDPEYDQMDVPEPMVDKRKQIEEANTEVQQVRLTQHLKIKREYGPVFTGGTFQVLKDGKHALCLRDDSITVYDTHSNSMISCLTLPKEDIVTFCLSPNGQMLALSNKSSLLRLFKMPEDLKLFGDMECLKTFKGGNQS